MEKHRKQAVILSTLGVVMILFGITYSFFNYTRTGLSNNITVGNISFNSNQTNTISLLDVFPIDKEDANSSSHVGVATINITGGTTYDDGVEYVLKVSNLTNTVGNKEIPIDVIVTASGIGEEDDDYFENHGPGSLTSIYKVLSNGTISNNQELLVGYIKKGSTGINGTVTVKAYLDKDKIGISDTYYENATATPAPTAPNDMYGTTTEWADGKIILTTDEWNNLQANGVSFQIKVEANEGTWVEETLTGEKMVRKAITAKINAATNSCNPIWIDDIGTQDESDDITYFSGTNDCVDMNYVWYSGKLWRITAIYPDGAMKLVTENNITSITFNASGQVNFYTDSNTTSYMYQWLNEDFYDTIYNANQLIDASKQWNATTQSNTTISTKPQETNMVTANVGLLNNYEYYNSYRCIDSSTCTGSSDSTGYLNIRYYWWLLNPYNTSNIWRVRMNGYGDYNDPTNANGVRPSIYLKSGLEFTGDGSKQSPYKIVGDKDTGAANELVNTRISGEYIKLKNGNNEQLFRIIGVEDNKTKIIAMDYADNKATKKFAVGNTSGDGTIYGTGQTATQGEDTWYNYLTGTYEPNLETTYGPLFDSSTYYMGEVGSGQSYKLGICSSSSGLTKTCTKTSQVGTFNIGLPRYGEMLATQQSGGYSNSTHMWLINRYSMSYVWNINNYGNGIYSIPKGTYSARPTLHLKSTVKIISGTGTESDPYVVGL